MENTEIQEQKSPKKSTWKRVIFFIGRFVRRTIIGILLFLVFISTSIVIITQTESFRRWATPFLQDFLNDQLLGRVDFSDLEINLLRGLTLHDVRLMADGDTILMTSEISIGYDLERFLNKQIYVSHLTLESPRIKLLRNKDSSWNIDHIAKPTNDTTTAKPFDYLIHAYDIAIRNATLIMEDSLAPTAKNHEIDFSHLHLWNVNVLLSADANISKNDYNLYLKNCSFEERSGFSLKKLSLDAIANKNGIEVKEVQFITPKTNMQLQVKVDSVNIFESITSEKLASAPISLEIKADSLETEDLLRFLPDAGIKGSYKLGIDAFGTLEELYIKKLRIDSPFSHLNASGKLKHLDTPEKLTFQATAETSLINYDELQRVTPVLQLPKLDFLGTVKIRKAYVNASPADSIAITATTATKSGNVDGQLTIFLRSPLGYHGDASVENINLAAITHNPDLESSLNAKVIIAGKGIMLDELDASTRIEVWNSSVSGKKITKALFTGSSREQGIVKVDTLFVDVQEPVTDDGSTYLVPHDTSITTLGLPGTMSLSGEFDLRNLANPLYNFKAQFESFPLAKLMDNKNYPTSMSVIITSDGKGLHPDSLEGKLNADFNIVTFNDLTVLPWNLNVTIDRDKTLSTRTVRLRSTFINMLLDGKFTYKSLIDECSQQSEFIADYVKYNINKVKSLNTNNQFVWQLPESENGKTFLHPEIPIDMKFRLNIRDISPINALFPNDLALQSRGLFVGSIKADNHESRFTIDSLKIVASQLNIGKTLIKTDPLFLRADAKILHNGVVSSLEDFNIHSKCDSIITVNEIILKNPYLTYTYNSTIGEISAGVFYDNLIGVGVHGDFILDKNESLSMLLDTLTLGYGGKTWYLASKANISLSPTGLSIGKLELKRLNSEKISMSGLVSDSLFKDFNLTIQNFYLKDLYNFPFIDGSNKQLLKPLSGKVSNLVMTVQGTYSKPIITANGQFDTLAYNGVLIGNQTLTLNHEDKMISGELTIINPKISSTSKKLHVGIEQLPINCAFEPVEDRLSKKEHIIITAQANELSMAIFAPFIPGINKLQGLADAEISVEGISSNLHYGGTAQLSNASFVVKSTNIKYFAEGKFALKNNQVDINKLTLYNDPAVDLRGGKAEIVGNVKLKDFNIDSLDLFITSPKILVLSSASVATSPTLYGKFEISSGINPIHFFGTLKKPFLEGDVNILDANLTFPPDKKITTMNSTFKYTKYSKDGKTKIIIENDSLISKIDSLSKKSDSINVNSISSVREKDNMEETSIEQSISIADLIDYNLYIKIQGKFNLKMILSSIDQLEAEIGTRNQGDKLHYVKKPQQNIMLYGQVDVKTGSKYKFFKIFDASGGLDFTTGAMDNPGLNLIATYSNSRTIANKRSDYSVIITIKGTKNVPNLSITYKIDGLDAANDSSKVRGDALCLLLFGKTQDELGKGGDGSGTQNELGNLGNQVYNGLSGVLSNQIASLLQGTGIISDARIDLVGGVGNLTDAKLNLSGQIIGNLTWRVGGTLGDITSNGEFSIEAPLSIFGNATLLDNLILQLTKSANGSININRQQKDWEVKIGGRYGW